MTTCFIRGPNTDINTHVNIPTCLTKANEIRAGELTQGLKWLLHKQQAKDPSANPQNLCEHWAGVVAT